MQHSPAKPGVLPEFFESLLANQYAADHIKRIIAGCGAKRAATFRANTLRSDRDAVVAALDDAGIAWSPVEWYADAFVAEDADEKALGELPIYRRGGIYLQNLSAMIPALVLGARPGEDVCDMCAAPGGKTTQIAALTAGSAPITAVEMRAPRADKLDHNLRKLGARKVTVMRTDARRLDDFFAFDRVLLDAPCSGSGTLRADDPKLAERFTPVLIERSVKSQRALFAKALSLLKPGGTLVYSTCSILACENEDIVAEGLKRAQKAGEFEIDPIDADGFGEVPLLPTGIEGTLALCPDERYEGFFMAKVKRVR